MTSVDPIASLNGAGHGPVIGERWPDFLKAAAAFLSRFIWQTSQAYSNMRLAVDILARPRFSPDRRVLDGEPVKQPRPSGSSPAFPRAMILLV